MAPGMNAAERANFITFAGSKIRKIMHPEIIKISALKAKETVVFLLSDAANVPNDHFSKPEQKYIREQNKKNKTDFFLFDRLDFLQFVQLIPEGKTTHAIKENCRKKGDSLAGILNNRKYGSVVICDLSGDTGYVLAFAEGMALGSYQFLKYKSETDKTNTLVKIAVFSATVTKKDVDALSSVVSAVYHCRTLVNEPNSYLTALVFMKEIGKLGKEAGFTVEVLNRKKIEALKMGGLLGVNKGSHEPPAFAIMEWKPAVCKNKKPYVFVGKGVVFDSGGMNLKPGDSMSTMKDDMGGGAAVAAAVYAIAKAKLPVHVVGLVPATDNRPGPLAVVPGDVITMHNGMTVEVLNTDAEGRLILADALSYAKRYKPALVIDLATLTGSAVRAVGKLGIVAMQRDAEKELEELKRSGNEVYERLVELPSWYEYAEWIKSDIADLKNVGPVEAGAITAGKFLEEFTSFPYIHLDIAGPAYIEKRDSYRGAGGTGTGVRLLFDFVRSKV